MIAVRVTHTNEVDAQQCLYVCRSVCLSVFRSVDHSVSIPSVVSLLVTGN